MNVVAYLCVGAVAYTVVAFIAHCRRARQVWREGTAVKHANQVLRAQLAAHKRDTR